MNPELLNGGTLAFVGDAVMTLQVREYLVRKGLTHLNELQTEMVKYVNAKAQADLYYRIADRLNEEENDIYKRGRNFKSHSSAKNANIIDYKTATGIEALWGYWYLKDNKERLNEMFQLLMEDR